MAEEKEEEFWRWTEERWTNPNVDWRKGDIITAGIDVGSVSTQAVIMVDGEVYLTSNLRSGSGSTVSAERGINRALEGTDLPWDKVQFSIGTGYGRVNIAMTDRAVTEIACHGRGANFIFGNTIRTVLDVGGQDCKALRVNEIGKVTNFLMNDKCAAGTGRGMEVFADLISTPIVKIGDLSFQVDEEPPPVASTCVIYAKTEATALLRSGWPKNRVIAAYCIAMAHRISGLVERLGPIEPEFCITGGMSKNKGVINRIIKELGVDPIEAAKIPGTDTKYDPQTAGAIGAALFARDMALKKRKKAAKKSK